MNSYFLCDRKTNDKKVHILPGREFELGTLQLHIRRNFTLQNIWFLMLSEKNIGATSAQWNKQRAALSGREDSGIFPAGEETRSVKSDARRQSKSAAISTDDLQSVCVVVEEGQVEEGWGWRGGMV